MAAAWQNADGLQVPFGNYWSDSKNFVNRVRAVQDTGPVKIAVMDIDLAKLAAGSVSYTADLNNDGTLDGFHTGDFYLPAYASVRSCYVVMTEAAAGGTSIKLGTFTVAGAAIDDDSLITTTEGVLANLNTRGGRTYGAGVHVATSVDTASVGAADAYLALTVAGTFTAGMGRIYIEYIDPNGDA
jgi:hypothetical protein